jgi:nickel-dependent lactate racemase
MSTRSVVLPWGDDSLDVVLPERWHVQGILEPSSLPPCQDPVTEIRNALVAPVGVAWLDDVARAALDIAIIIDDAGRPTRVGRILPAVWTEIEAARA